MANKSRASRDVYPAYNNFISKLYGTGSDDIAIVREVTFQITNQCNLCCDYCYEHHKGKEVMSLDTGKRIVDLIIKMWKENKPNSLISKKTKTVILSFIGGEPLLEPELIDNIVEYFLVRCAEENCDLAQMFRISICTNGQNFFDDNVQNLINKYKEVMSLNVSIDGIKELHDAHRVNANGDGSFDNAFKAFLASNPAGYRSTKMTFVPSSFKYMYDSVKFILQNGADFVACNYAYEPMYTVEDAKVLYHQIKLIGDYMVETNDQRLITMMDWDVGRPLRKGDENDNRNWCGGTGEMLAFSPDGNAYPCLRYCPISIGKEKSEPMKIGDFDGIYNTKLTVEIKDYLDSITKTSQSTQECIDCPVQSGCGWCSAYNYECGSVNKRVTNICEAHKARSLGANRYHNKRFLALHDCKPDKIYLPKKDALKFISEEEWDELKRDEQAALDEYDFYLEYGKKLVGEPVGTVSFE